MFCYSISFSQIIPARPNKSDSKNQRQGEWIIFFDEEWKEVSDPVRSFYYRLISYRNDLPEGKVTDFYHNGVRQWEGSLLKDRPEIYDGVQTWYYENGQKKTEEIYRNNEPAGPPLAFLRNGEPANPLWKNDIYDRGYEYFQAENYEQAAVLFKQALEHAEAFLAKETEDYADILAWLTIVYHHLGNREEVLRHSLALSLVYKSIRPPDDADYLTSVFEVARNYKFLGQWEKSEEYFKEYLMLESRIASGHHSMYGLALSGLGDVYLETQRYSAALEILARSKSFYDKNPPAEVMETELVNMHLRRANTLAGHWTDGKKLLLDELKTIEKQKGKGSESYAFGLSALGNFYKMNGQLREAETCYLGSINGIDKIGQPENPLVLLSATIPLIEVYYQLGQPQLGEPFIRRTKIAILNLDKKTPGYDLLYTGFARRLVTFYAMMGNETELNKTLNEWLIFSKATFGTTSIEYLYALMAEGEHRLNQKHFSAAAGPLTEAVGIIDNFHPSEMSSSDVRLIAKVYQQLGTLNVLQGNSSQSTENYLRRSDDMYARLAEKEFIPEQIDVVLTRAVLNEMNGNGKAADILYDQCLQSVKKHFSEGHINYATILFAIARKSEMRNDLRNSRRYYGEGLKKLRSYIASVFPYLSIEEKEQFYKTNETFIHNFQSFAVRHHESIPELADELYDLQLATKGIVLQSVTRMRKKLAGNGNGQLTTTFEAWRSKKNELIRLYQGSSVTVNELDRLLEEIGLLERKLSEGSEDFSKWSKQKTITWRDVQMQLAEGEAAIEFLYVKDEMANDSLYVAMVVKKNSDHPAIVKFSPVGLLEGKSLNYYRNAVLNQLQDGESYGYYWKPLADHLQKISRVFVSSDGVFHQINFSTLFDKPAGHYLVDELEIRLVASTALLITGAGNAVAFDKVTVITHPDYGSRNAAAPQNTLNRSFDLDNVIDLPGTETEGKALSELFSQRKIAYTGFSAGTATEEVLKSVDSPAILHIATHGFFLSNENGHDSFGFDQSVLQVNPLLRSGLLLAGCQNQLWKNNALSEKIKDDGILTAFEASTLKLDHTQLVVLSACETGLGEIRNGEGVYGLQRAFIMAGAKQIVMSLWKVDDTATQEFMISFYKELLKVQDAGKAFRTSQLLLKQKYPEPYYWGAFVLTGI